MLKSVFLVFAVGFGTFCGIVIVEDEGEPVFSYSPSRLASMSKAYSPDVGVCGKFALAEFLHLQEKDASNLSDLLPESTPAGFSLLDLKNAAIAKGLSNAIVVQCSPDTLDRLKLPYIMHLEASSEHPDGHFIVVVEHQNSETVSIFDPRWREYFDENKTNLLRKASGNYLVSGSSNSKFLLFWTLFNLISLALIWFASEKG